MGSTANGWPDESLQPWMVVASEVRWPNSEGFRAGLFQHEIDHLSNITMATDVLRHSTRQYA